MSSENIGVVINAIISLNFVFVNILVKFLCNLLIFFQKNLLVIKWKNDIVRPQYSIYMHTKSIHDLNG